MKKLGESQFWGLMILLLVIAYGFGQSVLHRPQPLGPASLKNMSGQSQIPLTNSAITTPTYPTSPTQPSTPQASLPANTGYTTNVNSNVPLSQPPNGNSMQAYPSASTTSLPQTAQLPAPQPSHGKPIPPLASIDVNTGDLATLEELPGIGPAMAQRIINYRTQYGPFITGDQLRNVKGIGPKKLAKIEPYVRF